ncbi:DUF2797 domain-containing protein [Parvicella tangerina]|nr:DUF2797 domain-containing protein [Parvicella tangerina]
MRSSLVGDDVQYEFVLYNNLEPGELLPMNEVVGKKIVLEFQHVINCVVTGEKIKKTYGEGMSYEAYMNSPMAVESVLRPELSQIHEGIALRDEEWERKHHLQPHYVYLSKTAGIKVGVTRKTQVPTRWIDQGAVEALIIAETPYRQAAGLIEVALKDYISDKTNWRKMLTNDLMPGELEEAREYLLENVPNDLQKFLKNDEPLRHLHFPVLEYPEKVKSMKLDSTPIIEKKLVGIKGQYLIFEDGTVINIRSHAGYLVNLYA